MNKYSIYVLLALLWISMPLSAESTASEFIHGRHAIRLGWGDAFLASNYSFEPLYGMTFVPVYPQSAQPALDAVVGMPAPEADKYLRDYRFVELGTMRSAGHFFLEYQYQLTPLISVGMEVDYMSMVLRTQWYNGYNDPLKEHPYEHLHHFTLMPTVRFTYYCQRVLSLYSALGVGYAFYSDSPKSWSFQTDRQRPHNHGMALNVTALGISLGGKHWFFEVELGSFQSWAFNAANNGLYGSRLVSVAAGCRF